MLGTVDRTGGFFRFGNTAPARQVQKSTATTATDRINVGVVETNTAAIITPDHE